MAEGRIELEGTAGQIAWAGEIRERVNAEFDRVRASIEAGSNKFRALDRNETATLLDLLEEHRAIVLAAAKADFFIAHWQNPPDRLMRVLNADAKVENH